MSISFDRALGIHPQALALREARAEVLANNLANADTPGFKARDLDFKQMLGQAAENVLPMSVTNGQHLPSSSLSGEQHLMYRMPTQPSLDGNTVDTQQEIADFTKNVLDFQSSFQFLNSKFKGLSKALKGE